MVFRVENIFDVIRREIQQNRVRFIRPFNL